MPRPRTIHKINMVAGRGQESINFTSLGIGRHSKSVYNVVNRRVLPSNTYPELIVDTSTSDRIIEKIWTQLLGSTDYDQSLGVAIDSNNNVYITGLTWWDNLDGNTNAGASDAFLTKYDSDGDKKWTKLLGSDKFDYSYGVAIDSNNNVYITGYTSGNLDGNTNAGSYDAFLTKYDSDGDKKWTKMLGSDQSEFSYGVAIDSNNNVYITGLTQGNLDGNTNAGSYDAFLTKYDSDGDKKWTKMLGSDQSDYSYGVAIDSNNNVYITGYTSGNLDGNTNAGSYDAFLTKYDSDGDKKWTKMLGSDQSEYSRGVAIDSNNNVYITGYTDGNLDGNTNAGSYDVFLTKYDSDGDKKWTQQLGTSDKDYSNGVAIDSNNNVYITGGTEGNLDGNTNAGFFDAFLTKYDSDGDKKWTKMLGSDKSEYSRGVAIDSNNNVYITGITAGNLDGNTNAGSSDAFLTKYG